MAASPADSRTPRRLKWGLTLRFSALLFVFVALSGGTYLAVSSAVSAKEYDSIVANLAGRQRMLARKYAREIDQVLIALAVSDGERAAEMKEAASQTAARYEETLTAFLAGGEVDADEEVRVWIPPMQGVDLVEHLGHVKTAWEELRRIALLARGSDSSSPAGNAWFRDIETRTASVVVETDHVVTLAQKQSEARLRRVESYLMCAFILGVILFVATVAFVRSRIVVPLDRSVSALLATNHRLEGEIAQREQTAEELRKLSVAVDQSPATVVITDTNGTIEYVNPRFTETTGYTKEEAIGRNPRILKSGKWPKEAYKKLWDMILAGKTWRGEFHNKKKNGELYWESASISPIRNADGAVTHFLAVKEDITERKRTEEELRQAKAAAEASNRELEDTNRQLEESIGRANRMAVAAEAGSIAKSEFLANMSHEIRTPMTAILGFIDLIAEGCEGSCAFGREECHQHLATIARNGQHLLCVIDDILDLSKIEAGKLEVESLACAPTRIVADVWSLMQVRAGHKKLDFYVEYVGRVPETIRSDPIRLKQILVNLIGNAIKFTDQGGVRLVIRFVEANTCGRGKPAEPMMQFDILDTGVGMSRQQMANLFQPFMQADASTSRNFGGTGLGLTISRRFAELLGGGITVVESQEGVGTRFRATVATGPLEGVKMLATTVVTEAAGTAPPAAASSLDGVRILLAEDGPDNQRLITHILKKAGAEVAVQENGKLAVEVALAARDLGNPLDVILMDMQMPVMDGYQATRLLRQEGYEGPIIALTAHAMGGDRQKCLDAGCDDYATKPIDRKKLTATIRSHLKTPALT